MVSTKGMWLIHGLPLESKCYQSCVEHYRYGHVMVVYHCLMNSRGVKGQVYMVRVR